MLWLWKCQLYSVYMKIFFCRKDFWHYNFYVYFWDLYFYNCPRLSIFNLILYILFFNEQLKEQLNTSRKVGNVSIVVQLTLLCGEETVLGIIFAMLVDYITRWMVWTGHLSSSLVDWYLKFLYFAIICVLG